MICILHVSKWEVIVQTGLSRWVLGKDVNLFLVNVWQHSLSYKVHVMAIDFVSI